jgi:hypothetical protein
VTAALDGILIDVQRRLCSLYALEAQPPVTDFVIPHAVAGEYPGGGSRTLVTEDKDGIALGVVLEDEVGVHLSRQDPRVCLDRVNLGPFCTLTEEVSHFVYLLFCARTARSITQLELELQAEVDKYLSAVFLLALQQEAISPRLRELLFRHYHLADGLTTERAERYRAASQLAERYCSYLESQFLRRARLTDLAREARRFYRMGQREKLEKIAELGVV